jgi:hypothetical protein
MGPRSFGPAAILLALAAAVLLVAPASSAQRPHELRVRILVGFKTLTFSLPSNGVYSVFVDPQSNGVGSVTLAVS